MQVQRTIPIAVPDDPDVLATIRRFQLIQQTVSCRAFALLTRAGGEGAGDGGEGAGDGGLAAGDANGGGEGLGGNGQRRPPSALTLHRACYTDQKGLVSAQLTASAIRGVAGAYWSAWRKGHRPRRHFAFRRPLAVWLIGERGRDASLPEDGTLSLWTVAGRKRLPFTVPPHFRDRLAHAVRVNSLTIIADPVDAMILRWDDEDDNVDGGDERVDDERADDERVGRDEGGGAYGVRLGRPLRAWLTVTIEAPDPVGQSPVGIDRGVLNALVAVDADDRVLFLSGREHQARNERTRQVRRRVRRKLAVHKAHKRDTRSARRLLKRLSQKQRDRTRTFARQAAARLCAWAPPGAAFVLEELRLPARQLARREQAAGRLTGWFHGLLGRCIRDKAQERGIPLVAVHPAFTSRDCSRCGARGRRRGHQFVCPRCGHAEHADVNGARNVRNAGVVQGEPRNAP